jgi:hypothetical protein
VRRRVELLAAASKGACPAQHLRHGVGTLASSLEGLWPAGPPTPACTCCKAQRRECCSMPKGKRIKAVITIYLYPLLHPQAHELPGVRGGAPAPLPGRPRLRTAAAAAAGPAGGAPGQQA